MIEILEDIPNISKQGRTFSISNKIGNSNSFLQMKKYKVDIKENPN